MKRKINFKVIVSSLIGLACLYLSFTINWLFIIGSAIAVYLSQKDLLAK